MPELCSRDRAEILLAHQVFAWGEEEVALSRVQGRILAEPLVADRDQPAFNRVAMDGISVQHAAYARGQRFFVRERVQAAGQQPTPLVDASRCIEIMTGAPLPAGCTTVVPYEVLRETAGGYHLPEGILDNANIHARGKDAQRGEHLAPVGTRVDVAAVGMLASFGYATVRVKRLPRVAIIATGDELVNVDQQPQPHQIRLSNLYQLSAALAKRGYVASQHHLPDDPGILTKDLGRIIEHNDVVILSGGVSKGRFDYVPSVLEALRVEKLFHGVAQRPGKPIWAGRNGETMVFGLPGNPQSSLSCCLAYVIPFLDRNTGCERAPVYAALAVPVDFKPNLTLFSYVRLAADPATGQLLATPVKHAGSGDAASLLRGGGFLELPAGKNRYEAGEVYQVRKL
ncbi:molybdopterin molybdotransferase MoeA [Neolewinella antarctica]|uniref:Molybdopterin molybdenumtransferase n=1 Tax=Neolewinella antarctica TaxID=442734 RepID=A0ABX0XAR1_9BACT|nr:molybdopterin molybdotransferase MoeA [Neolewinella antarctica]NJC26325.1 molybdopterin molybdotransferase [Neolewinella antarctica]